VGSGRLKLNPDDAREDTPRELKELMVICSHHDRDKRLDFVQINQALKPIKLTKHKKMVRAQSVPNVSFTPDTSNLNIESSIYEDEIYPASPQIHDVIYENYDEVIEDELEYSNISRAGNRKHSDFSGWRS
jgi:hypothetical protein